MSTVEYYNGSFVDVQSPQVPLEERGHQFGDGVYEVIKVYGGRPFLLDWHMERMVRSLRVIGIENPHSPEAWVDLIGEAVRRCGEADAQIYIQVTRGIAPRNHTFPDGEPSVSMIVRAAKQSTRPSQPTLLALPDERWVNAFVKSINLLPNVIAKETAHRHGAHEAMYVRDGLIMEGSGSNIFFVRQGKLYTAPSNRYILGGITRRFVLELAKTLDIDIVEEAIPLSELTTVDEVFITSTTQEIQQIARIVTPEHVLPALSKLPSVAPDTLLVPSGVHQELWHCSKEGDITNALEGLFAQTLERFRNHEEVMV
jgi:D-alanine transaminase